MCIIPKEISVLEGLVEAKRIVNKGWCQNQYVNNELTEYCTVGAIFFAARAELQPDVIEVFFKANDLGNKVISNEASLYAKMIAISAWNDSKGTTKEEVVGAFDKAIESCLKY